MKFSLERLFCKKISKKPTIIIGFLLMACVL